MRVLSRKAFWGSTVTPQLQFIVLTVPKLPQNYCPSQIRVGLSGTDRTAQHSVMISTKDIGIGFYILFERSCGGEQAPCKSLKWLKISMQNPFGTSRKYDIELYQVTTAH